MSTTTLATRLPGPLLDEVRRFARRRRLGPSEALRAIVAEWVTTSSYPALEYRSGPGGREVALRGGPAVVEVARVVRELGEDVAAVAARFDPPLAADATAQALAYAGEHREEIEAQLEEEPERRIGVPPSASPGDPARAIREAVRGMTVERKLRVAHGLREMAWETKAAAIRAASPGLAEAEVQERVRRAFRDALR